MFFNGLDLVSVTHHCASVPPGHPGPRGLPRVQKPSVVELAARWSLCTAPVLDGPGPVPFLLRRPG